MEIIIERPETQPKKLKITLYLAQSANPENINQQIKNGVTLENLTFVSMVTDKNQKPTTIELDHTQKMNLHNEIMGVQMQETMSRPIQPSLTEDTINRARPKKYKYSVLKNDSRQGTTTCLTRLLPGDACDPTKNQQYPIFDQSFQWVDKNKEILNMEIDKTKQVIKFLIKTLKLNIEYPLDEFNNLEKVKSFDKKLITKKSITDELNNLEKVKSFYKNLITEKDITKEQIIRALELANFEEEVEILTQIEPGNGVFRLVSDLEGDITKIDKEKPNILLANQILRKSISQIYGESDNNKPNIFDLLNIGENEIEKITNWNPDNTADVENALNFLNNYGVSRIDFYTGSIIVDKQLQEFSNIIDNGFNNEIKLWATTPLLQNVNPNPVAFVQYLIGKGSAIDNLSAKTDPKTMERLTWEARRKYILLNLFKRLDNYIKIETKKPNKDFLARYVLPKISEELNQQMKIKIEIPDNLDLELTPEQLETETAEISKKIRELNQQITTLKLRNLIKQYQKGLVNIINTLKIEDSTVLVKIIGRIQKTFETMFNKILTRAGYPENLKYSLSDLYGAELLLTPTEDGHKLNQKETRTIDNYDVNPNTNELIKKLKTVTDSKLVFLIIDKILALNNENNGWNYKITRFKPTSANSHKHFASLTLVATAPSKEKYESNLQIYTPGDKGESPFIYWLYKSATHDEYVLRRFFTTKGYSTTPEYLFPPKFHRTGELINMVNN